MNNLKNLISATLAFGLLALLPGMAAAQGVLKHRESISHREQQQHRRIQVGVKHGSLTAKEASRLRAREAAIRARTHRDRKDGHGLSLRERSRLQHSLTRTSKSIHRQSHDQQHRH